MKKDGSTKKLPDSFCDNEQRNQRQRPQQGTDRTSLALGQKPFPSRSDWQGHVAVILDHAHDVSVKLAHVIRHLLFVSELLTVDHDFLGHGSVVLQSFLVGRANFWRQLIEVGILLTFVADLGFDVDVHRLAIL